MERQGSFWFLIPHNIALKYEIWEKTLYHILVICENKTCSNYKNEIDNNAYELLSSTLLECRYNLKVI